MVWMASGEGVWVEAHEGQQLAHPRSDPRRRPPFELRDEPNVPLHREVREKPHFLNHVADPAPQTRHRQVGRTLARDLYVAGSRLEQAIDELERGGLPGPAAAQQHQRLPGADGEGDVPHEGALSRQLIAEPTRFQRRDHRGEARTMRNRSSSLRPCQRAVSPASERIRRNVSAAYLYERFIASRSPRARRT